MCELTADNSDTEPFNPGRTYNIITRRLAAANKRRHTNIACGRYTYENLRRNNHLHDRRRGSGELPLQTSGAALRNHTDFALRTTALPMLERTAKEKTMRKLLLQVCRQMPLKASKKSVCLTANALLTVGIIYREPLYRERQLRRGFRIRPQESHPYRVLRCLSEERRRYSPR